jgi:hypothetical protein
MLLDQYRLNGDQVPIIVDNAYFLRKITDN